MLKKDQLKEHPREHPKKRLSSAERRQRILAAAVPLFAHEGFRGVTTKALAQEAGVSEALLYQHFPSKEHLYREVQAFYCRPSEELRRLVGALPATTESVVQILFFLAKVTVERVPIGLKSQLVFPRLMMFSLLDDGAFARLYLGGEVSGLVGKLTQCLRGAHAVGDLAVAAVEGEVTAWLCHHLIASVSMLQLPEEQVLPYSASAPLMIKQLTLYMLRGVGLSAAAIGRSFDDVLLTKVAATWLAAAADTGSTVTVSAEAGLDGVGTSLKSSSDSSKSASSSSL